MDVAAWTRTPGDELRDMVESLALFVAVVAIAVAVWNTCAAQYQQQLLDDAVSKYGSQERAARWVATPDTSAHVSGDAVDIGPSDAAAWLSRHGAEYGLCQIYANEPWHYELRPRAGVDGCPPMYADARR